jgi:peptide/nickel transport system permease protein
MEGKGGKMRVMNLSEASPGRIAWNKFKKNPLAVAGFILILLMVVIAILGYSICPDKSPYANTQHLELSGNKPGFRVKMLKIRKNETLKESGFFNMMFYGRENEFEEIPILSYSFSGSQITVKEYTEFPDKEDFYHTYNIVDAVYPLAPGSRDKKRISGDSIFFTTLDGQNMGIPAETMKEKIQKEQISERVFYLGTDRFGRDLLSRIILGAKISLMVGFIAVCISLIIGVLMGAVAGYYRGRTDQIIMWVINVIWSIPTLLLVIALTMVIGRGFWQVFVAVGVTMWVEVARVVRGQVLSLREKEFIEAAKVLGYSDMRIISKHIIPNIISPVIIISAANFASAILIEAGLSFLGIGVQPPIPSWGGMVKDHYGFILAGKAYLAFIPGFAIMLIVLAFTMFGNGLRDAFDIRKD